MMKLGLIAYVAICAQLIGAYEHSCGFENGLCTGWHQSSFDDFNWSRNSGSTWSSLTGPTSGNGGYGFYMYIETSSPRSYGDKANLSYSPPDLLIGKASCLRFYYHMYGATINRLNVFNGYSIVFTKSGQQGNRWRYSEVTVVVQSTISFEGITGSSFTGDIAIDDVSLTHGICTGCKHTLNDSFGHLNITYNEKFAPDCIWTLLNSGISEPVAIVSIEEVQFSGYCSDYIKVWDGSGSLVFTRVGCQSNYAARTFLEIAFQNSQNVTIQVSLHNYQSHARVSHGIIKNGLGAASLLTGWNVTLENKTSNSLQLRWMDINHRLNSGVRFFVVISKSSYSSVPVRKIFSPNITSAEITELDPYTVYNVSVVAIDGNGLPFHSSILQARTDESVPNSAPSGLIVTNVTATSLTVQWNQLPQHYHNGRLLGYRVYFRKTANYSFPVAASSVAVYISSWVTLNNLEPGQSYEIYVTGFTSKGNGPRSYGYFVITACSLSVNHSLGLIDVASSANNNPLNCSWTIGNVGIANAVATFIIERINISSCREHFKIADGAMTSKYDQRGRLRSILEQIVVVPFLSSAEISISISLIQPGSSVKAKYMVLRSALYSAPVLPGWNITISNETSLSFSVQWTNLTALLGSQVEHFIVLLKWNRNNNSNVFHKIVNGRESRTEITGLLSSSQYTVEVFGTDKMGQPYKTLEVRARTLNAICGKRPTRSTVIVGGTVAPINSWPWQALLRTRDGRQFCGGSLIKPEWVLTATHCVVGKSPSDIQVTLGAHYLSTASVVGTEQHVDVVQIIQHENYNSPKRWSNDVALLKLSRPAELRNGVGLVCLSDDQFQRPFNGRSCWTTGWGTLSWPGPQPKELMQVDLPLVSPQNCSSTYPTNYDPNTMLCAGTSQLGTGACKGDSGGPLVCEFKGKWYLEGVTSWVWLPCTLPSKPTVYADVRKLKSWILRKMNDELVSNCSSVINNTLKSPGYPSYYPRNKVCVYQVPIPCDMELVIYFNYFHLEGSLINCWYDYLRITDGSNRVIGTFCGRQTGRSVLVNDTIAVLTFKTDGSVQYIGFHLSFLFFPRGAATLPPFVSPTPITTQRPTTTTSPGCGSAQNNSLRSPGYPNNYPNNMHCIYRVPIPFDQYLLVYFTYFSVESHSSCAYDYLRITDGSTYYTIGTYCGYRTGQRVRVDGSVAVLTFHSDGSVQSGGFYLSFSFFPQPRGCDFENGLCPGWYQSYTDDFDWTRYSGPTSSYMTGPSTGHGGYGYYMYIETSSPRLYGDRARLRFSPPRSATGKLSCLKFYYHMYGATINQLNVFNGSTIAFTKSGQQGNRWLFAEVTVFARNTITFEGIRGSSFTGDIAIDDVSLVDGVCTGCTEALNDSFGQLNITFNETFSPDCKWIIGNAEISQAIAIVSIEEAQFSYCSGYIKVLDGSSTEVFSREGCLGNHTPSVFLEIAIQESQNITIRVSLNNNQSYVSLSYGILKDDLHAASPLAGWNITLENKTSSSLQLRWMDINHRLNGGVRFFVVIAKSSYNSVPVRKLFSPNITRAEITGLDPHTVYNVSVVAIDGYGLPFRSTVLHAKTDGWSCGFEDGLCRGWYQSYDDDFDWMRRLGPTWPYNSGPSSGHGGYGFYMYIETWPQSYGDKAKLLFSPPNSVIGTMSCLKFYYHMYGATINRLNVFNGNSIVFTRSGQQGNRWLYTEVTIFVKSTITFEGIVGSSYTGNIAIDDVSLMDGACTVCGFVQNNTLRSPYYPGLYPRNLFCVYRINIPRGKDLNIHFNSFSLEYHSNCTYHDYLRIASNTCNVIGTFCGQQTGTSIRVAGYYALLTFHTDQSVQKTGFDILFSYSVFPVSCNFNCGLCPGWSQSTADVFNWTRGTGNTPSTDTGPSSEHTSESGYYMYIESSSPRREGDNAKLVLSLRGNGELGCLSFHYHMYGENMGTLNVFIGNMKVFTESGDHGNTWIKADRTIVLGNNVIFEGIRGSGFHGDLAIDDVLVTNGSCVSPVPTTLPPTRRPATPAGCTDKLSPSVCSVFARSDTCASLYNYTLENCAKTCGFCRGCSDKLDSSVCNVFVSSGSCHSLYNYTSVHCAKTCGFCGGIVSTTARPNTVTFISSPSMKSSTSSVVTTALSIVPSFPTPLATSAASTSSPAPFASPTHPSFVKSSTSSPTTTSSTSSAANLSYTYQKSSVTSQTTPSGSNATKSTPNTLSPPSTQNPTARGPSENAVKESVVLRVTGLDIDKWDQRMENSFKAEVARSATEYCKRNPARCLPNTTRSRRRRSSDIVFSPDMVHILQGYPKQSPEDPEVTMIAFYLSFPPEISQGTVVSEGMLTTVVESNMQSIGRSMDSSIVSVKPLRSLSMNKSRTNEPEGDHTGAIAGGVVGGCFFLVVGAVLVVYLRKRRAVLNPEDSHHVVNKSTDGALEMKEGVVSFSNDIYGVSPSKNSRPSAVYENPMSFDNHAYEDLK